MKRRPWSARSASGTRNIMTNLNKFNGTEAWDSWEFCSALPS